MYTASCVNHSLHSQPEIQPHLAAKIAFRCGHPCNARNGPRPKFAQRHPHHSRYISNMAQKGAGKVFGVFWTLQGPPRQFLILLCCNLHLLMRIVSSKRIFGLFCAKRSNSKIARIRNSCVPLQTYVKILFGREAETRRHALRLPKMPEAEHSPPLQNKSQRLNIRHDASSTAAVWFPTLGWTSDPTGILYQNSCRAWKGTGSDLPQGKPLKVTFLIRATRHRLGWMSVSPGQKHRC